MTNAVLPSEISIKISVDPSIAAFGSNVTITGKISPPLSLPIKISVAGDYMWGRPDIVNSFSDGTFTYTWMPSGRGTFFVTALWEGNQNYFASKSNTQKFKVIGGPGPFWLELGTYLHYKHTLNGTLMYEFRGAMPMMRPGPEPPLDLACVYESGDFPDVGWVGPLYYVNMSTRDMLGRAYFEKQGKTPLWIDPEIFVGDIVEIYEDYYKVTGSSYVSFLGGSREAWILENPYRILWYDKKLGILLKGTGLVHPRAEYPFSILLYDTNIRLESAIFRPAITENATLSFFTFKNDAPIVSDITIFDENKTLIETIEDVVSYGWLLDYGVYHIQASIFYNEHSYTSDQIMVNLTKHTELAINFLFGNLTLSCLDFENRPMVNCTLELSREDAEYVAYTDSSGSTILEAYYGNWIIEAYWMNVPVGRWNIIMNKTEVQANIQCNVGDFIVIIVNQYGDLIKANVTLANATYGLSFSGYLNGIIENYTLTQIPLIDYTLTVKDDYETQTYNVDMSRTRQIRIEKIVPKPFIETPLGIATISAGIIAAIATTLIILKRRKI